MTTPPLQPPGWYTAQGDPPGTHRWWDGAQWVGGPVAVGGGGTTAPGYAPPGYAPPGYAPPGAGPMPYATIPSGYAPAYGPQYAGFWIRVAAWFLDGLIVGVPSGIVRAIVGAAVPTHVVSCSNLRGQPALCERPTAAGALVLILVLLATVAASAVYYVSFHGRTGQTIGKRACGIKVVDERTGAPIGTGRAIGRWFGSILSALPCGLGLLWPAWDAKKQTWHDKMVSSIVITVK